MTAPTRLGQPAPATLLLNDLRRHAAAVQDIVAPAVARVVARGWYVLGEECRGFEAEFAEFCGARHCVGVANGTDALELALRAVGVVRGMRVAAVANAGGYTATALAAIGAEPVFVDVTPDDALMDLAALRRTLAAESIDAVVATHLYGLMADMADVMQAARTAGPRPVPVVEDCAQAHGATRGGQRAGSFGDAAAFSFYPTKNLGALGDAGAVVTGCERTARRVEALRQYGWNGKYRVELAGGRNSRLDELQAAVLRAKLPHLDAWTQRRQAIAAAYSAGIRHPSVATPPPRGAEFVCHLYVVRTAGRAGLQRHLTAAGIGSDVHYPVPDHRQPAWEAPAPPSLPITEALAEEALTLPCFPEMTDAEIRHVVSSVNAWR